VKEVCNAASDAMARHLGLVAQASPPLFRNRLSTCRVETMRGRVERPRRHDAGQALAEYGIVLALASGLRWIGNLTGGVLDQPPMVLLGGGVAAVAIVYIVTRR
jgi:hypothetical protein